MLLLNQFLDGNTTKNHARIPAPRDSIQTCAYTPVSNAECEEPRQLRRDYFHAREKTKLVEKLLAIVPSKAEGTNVHHAKPGDDG